MAALVVAFVLNGLRELGEPARKALISSSFPKEYPRARGRAVLGLALVRLLRRAAGGVAALEASRPGDTCSSSAAQSACSAPLWFWLRVRCRVESKKTETENLPQRHRGTENGKEE